MTFIITLVSLLIERFFDWSHLRDWQWFSKYRAYLTPRLKGLSNSLVFVVLLALPLILIGILMALLETGAFGLLKIAFGIVILLYCLGPKNFWAQSSTLTARSLFIEFNHAIFAVVFWFVILGPIGAVLYRLIDVYANDEATPIDTKATAVRIQKILDWVPARLLSLLFALAGHFTEVLNVWRSEAKQGLESNDQIISDCGIAALDKQDATLLDKEALSLIDRTLILVLVIVSVSVFLV